MIPGSPVQSRSLSDVHNTVPIDHVTFWRRMLAFAGPAYLVSVGYMDPGNWATELQGGNFCHPALGIAGSWQA